MRNGNAKLWAACLGAALVAAVAAGPAIAAKGAATVKVALLDMTSVSGMGMMGRA